jgi:hypothetical protein
MRGAHVQEVQHTEASCRRELGYIIYKCLPKLL